MLCRHSGEECKTPGMCAPYGGCPSSDRAEINDLRARVLKLERIVEHLCPDKSNDI
jgi:hypothetical protein